MGIDFGTLSPVSLLRGEDEEDTSLLEEMHKDAESYLRSFAWCRGIKTAYVGLGIGGVVAVFLFQIRAPADVDEWLWVVVGDLPPAYLVTDDAPTPLAALRIYCNLMSDWVEAIQKGTSLDEVFPVGAPATKENADLLGRRLETLRTSIIPTHFEGGK